MKEFIDILNQNGVAIQVFLTVALVFVTGFYAWHSGRMANLLNKELEIKYRPYISISNPAKNLNLTLINRKIVIKYFIICVSEIPAYIKSIEFELINPQIKLTDERSFCENKVVQKGFDAIHQTRTIDLTPQEFKIISDPDFYKSGVLKGVLNIEYFNVFDKDHKMPMFYRIEFTDGIIKSANITF
jgi:hypothetical protein